MAKLLRKVQYKPNWDPKGEFSKYLPPGHAPADALLDLRTRGNALSVWQIDDQESNLERVLAAMVSTGEHLQTTSYLIVDMQHITQLRFSLIKSTGDTHDAEANDKWHFDLTKLSASDLATLANTMLSQGKTDRRNPKALAAMLRNSVQQKFVDDAKLNPKVQTQISG